MIISRTPFRISFFGGGSDYREWYRAHGGAVISTSFDKYTYVSCRQLPPFFDFKYRIAYSKLENVLELSQIEHPAIRAVLNESGIQCGLEIHCDADLPARSGLGSSSSFVVGLLNTLAAFEGKRVARQALAEEAIRIEQEVLKETVGSQDQTAAAFGGFNLISFGKDGSISVQPIILPPQRKTELNDHLMLFFTGFSRFASEVAESKVRNIDEKAKSIHRIRSLVDDALQILDSDRDIAAFGELLHEGWTLKQGLSEKVSNEGINALYARAREAGAIGGKLLGAGGGGFMLLFAKPEMHAAIRYALDGFVHVPFQFETSGSQIVHYAP